MKIFDVHLGEVEIPDEVFPCDFICDIDGTVADVSHRQHWVRNKPKNWGAFFKAMSYDTPITRVVNKVKDCQKLGGNLIMCSGRPEDYRKETEDWLEYNGLIPTRLYMRKSGDYRQDDIVKFELYSQMLIDGWKPKFVFDDRNQVVKMWRSKGMFCIQVAEGDF